MRDFFALLITPVRYFRTAECGHARAAVPLVAAGALGAAMGGAHISKITCGVPAHVLAVIGVMDFVFVLFVACVVFALFCVVAVVAGDEEQSRGRLLKFLSLSYWISLPPGVVTLVVFYLYSTIDDRAGFECIPYGGGMEWFIEVVEAMNDPRLLQYRNAIDAMFGYLGLLVVGWQCCALHVVSRCSIRVSVASGVVVGALFVVLPWALGRLG